MQLPVQPAGPAVVNSIDGVAAAAQSAGNASDTCESSLDQIAKRRRVCCDPELDSDSVSVCSVCSRCLARTTPRAASRSRSRSRFDSPFSTRSYHSDGSDDGLTTEAAEGESGALSTNEEKWAQYRDQRMQDLLDLEARWGTPGGNGDSSFHTTGGTAASCPQDDDDSGNDDGLHAHQEGDGDADESTDRDGGVADRADGGTGVESNTGDELGQLGQMHAELGQLDAELGQLDAKLGQLDAEFGRVNNVNNILVNLGWLEAEHASGAEATESRSENVSAGGSEPAGRTGGAELGSISPRTMRRNLGGNGTDDESSEAPEERRRRLRRERALSAETLRLPVSDDSPVDDPGFESDFSSEPDETAHQNHPEPEEEPSPECPECCDSEFAESEEEVGEAGAGAAAARPAPAPAPQAGAPLVNNILVNLASVGHGATPTINLTFNNDGNVAHMRSFVPQVSRLGMTMIGQLPPIPASWQRQ